MQTLRKRTFDILDTGLIEDRVSQIVDIFLISLISLNVLFVILETLPSLKHQYHTFFYIFETISVMIFSVEYFTRVWSSIENTNKAYAHPLWGRLRYMLSPMAIIDLIVILPLYLGFFLAIDLRFLRVLRLLRVFKLTRYSSSMTLLLQVLKDEARSIGAAFFVLFMLIIMASSLTYLAEHDAQPVAFSSIPAAMWWAIITMTSVGYGDVTPVTNMGKVLASIISIISIGIVALPAGILASGFSEALRQRRAHYENRVVDAMRDGVLTIAEQQSLIDLQELLDINSDEAELILHNHRNKQLEKDNGKYATEIENDMKVAFTNTCPHCGHAIDWHVERRKK